MDLEHQSQLMKLLEEEFICPIYKMPIHNPVITPVGITYEKEALEEWLDINGVEPQSKNPLNKQSLVQNLALKELIGKIYKEVPKLERSLTEKDDMIANLTEEVAQLKKELEYEKQKSRENEELTDFTLEKTKKIRKIQEEAIGQKEMERMKLKQKLKEISRLRQALNKEKTGGFLLKSQVEDSKNEITLLKRKVQDLTNERNKISEQRQNFQRACSILQLQAREDSWANFWHQKHIIQSVLNKKGELARLQDQPDLSLDNFKAMVDSGVDEILRMREQSQIACSGFSKHSVSLIRRSFKELHNKILIQRYMLNKQLRENRLSLNFHYTLSIVGKAVGYEIDFLPFSQRPTEQELQIDWHKVKGIFCSFSQEQWEIFISQINKFPNLTVLKIPDFTVNNITCAQLFLMTNLKKIKIHSWKTFNENQRQQIDNFRQNKPGVQVVLHHNHHMQNQPDFDNLEPGWQNGLLRD